MKSDLTNYHIFRPDKDEDLREMAKFIYYAQYFGMRYEVISEPFYRSGEIAVFWERP